MEVYSILLFLQNPIVCLSSSGCIATGSNRLNMTMVSMQLCNDGNTHSLPPVAVWGQHATGPLRAIRWWYSTCTRANSHSLSELMQDPFSITNDLPLSHWDAAGLEWVLQSPIPPDAQIDHMLFSGTVENFRHYNTPIWLLRNRSVLDSNTQNIGHL